MKWNANFFGLLKFYKTVKQVVSLAPCPSSLQILLDLRNPPYAVGAVSQCWSNKPPFAQLTRIEKLHQLHRVSCYDSPHTVPPSALLRRGKYIGGRRAMSKERRHRISFWIKKGSILKHF